MRKFFARFAVATVVVAATIMGIQSPAAAAWGCPSGVGCVYDNLNGGGAMKIIAVGSHNVNQCYNFSASWDNKVESLTWSYGLYAGHKLIIRLYSNQGCQPYSYTIAAPPGNLVGAYRNDASSFMISTI